MTGWSQADPQLGARSSSSWPCINEAVWRNSTSTDFWIGFKLWGAIPLTFLFAAANMPMLLRHGLTNEDEAADEAGTDRMSEPILTIRGLRKAYEGGVEALKGVDLDIQRGEIFALLGPNGAGKTTLIASSAGSSRRRRQDPGRRQGQCSATSAPRAR